MTASRATDNDTPTLAKQPAPPGHPCARCCATTEVRVFTSSLVDSARGVRESIERHGEKVTREVLRPSFTFEACYHGGYH